MRTTLALTFLLAATAATAADPQAPSAKAYALNINHPPKDAPKEIVSPPYIGVYVFIQTPGKQIVALDPAETKLTLTDDKGTDLMPKSPVSGPSIPTANSRDQARLYVTGAKMPVAGATRVKLKGDLVLLCGTAEKTASAEKFALKDKEKVEVGPASFEVALQKGRTVVNLKAASASVKSVTFTDAEGKPLAVGGTLNLNTSGGKIGQTAVFVPPAKTETLGIKVTYYEKVEAVKIPVDTDTGVGP
jgi:hypothetical protein